MKKPMRSRVISKEEMEEIGHVPSGRGHWVRKSLAGLAVGKALFVDRMDWNWAGKTPNVIVLDMNRNGPKEFEFSEARDGSGWIIERVK